VDLSIVTALFVAFALTLYALLDGFDLGVGALLLVQKDERMRDRMIDAIAPTWDGNETWLVMAAIALFAGFPSAYGVMLPALYLALIVMLLSLGIRGVTFEFRAQSIEWRRAWSTVFGVASVVAALAQGAALGTLLLGIQVENGGFAGSVFDVMSPQALIAGCTLLGCYVMLGAGWLRLKESGELRTFAGRVLRSANLAFLSLAALAWLVAAVHPEMRARLSARWPGFLLLAILVLGSAVNSFRSITRESDRKPFVFGLLQCALAGLALWLVIYPDVVPFRMTLWSAASAPPTQELLLTGAAMFTPIILIYSAFGYRVFRGKVAEESQEP